MPVPPEIFRPAGLNHVRMFLILFCVGLAATLIVNFRDQFLYFRTAPQRLYGRPPGLLGWLPAPSLSSGQFWIAGAVLIVSLLGVAAGVVPHLLLAIALVCHFVYFNPITSLAYVQRKANLAWVVLLILLVSPALDRPLREPAPQWPIVLAKIALAQMYLAAGVQKLRRTGWRWCSGGSLQAYLVEHYLWGDMTWAFRVARSAWLCRILSTGVLAFELTFILIVIVPGLTWWYVMAGVAFHAGTAAVMRIDYWKYVAPVYLVFVTAPALQLVNWFTAHY